MIYPLMDPPNFKAYDNMTRNEAKKHLEWYINQIPQRLELLENAFEATGGNKKELDYSVESLKKIWEWFIPRIVTEPKHIDELVAEDKILPRGVYGKSERVSINTLAITKDIAIYFGEVFIRNCKNVKWGLAKSRSKNYINYNKPVLLGFRIGKYETEIDPSRIIYSKTLKVAFDGDKNIDALMDAYSSGKEKAIS